MNESTKAASQATGIRADWRQSEQDATNAKLAKGGTTKIRIYFPFQVKQIGPNLLEAEVVGATEDPLTDACFERLKALLGEREAMRIERKAAELVLREQIMSMMEVS